MKVRLTPATESRGKGKTRARKDLLVVPVFEGRLEFPHDVGATARKELKRSAEIEGFAGRADQTLISHVTSGDGFASALLIGVGSADRFCPSILREALGTVIRRLPEGLRKRGTTAVLALDGPGGSGRSRLAPWQADRRKVEAVPLHDCVQAAAEGWILGSYSYSERRQTRGARPFPSLDVRVGTGTTKKLQAAIRAAEAIADATTFARDLANTPGNAMDPTTLARRAKEYARETGFTCRVLDEAAIRRERMGALLGVAQGSDRPPRFLILEYSPRTRHRGSRPLVLVGKAITFDSGGLSIKPAKGMEEMKMDMSGGAAVVAALGAIARLGLPRHVVGLVPCAENMVSGGAIKPGDVVTSRAGLTIEVVNTDAEGRLVLADALDYARRYKPQLVVDLATLTGACIVALGTVASGAMGVDDAAVQAVLDAATQSGERIWRLPLYPEYFEVLKTDAADVRNSAGRPAAASTAAAFLARFAEGLPWVHLDIAGPAWSTQARGSTPKGGTGVGVRTLVALARDLGR